MPRKKCLRYIGNTPDVTYYKPAGIPMRVLEEVVISLDEMEAIRLADHENFYQEEAARLMNISRQTFGRILESAHRKIAEALLQGKAIRIEGGNVELNYDQQ
ncbi:MAG: DUF134 domain-containing protein [Cyclobacteriaceae bacterium]|nr:DUF134 domain-containing protein [Cyclobacteriaceae bacterium]